MNQRDLFLDALRASLEGRTVEWGEDDVSQEQWQEIFEAAAEHNVVPMIYQSVFGAAAFRKSASGMNASLKRFVVHSVIAQVQKTEEFKKLYQHLSGCGLEPIIVKGIILRSVYKNPDNRPSGDEDFYIQQGSYETYKKVLNGYGMELAEWDQEKESVNHEVTYVHTGGCLTIELHKDLFDAGLSAYKGMNDLFADAFERSVLLDIDGIKVRTLNHTDHMLFLISHALKHFVGSGFGIRQVCDIVVFGNHYGKEMDWDYLLDKCKKIHAELFAAAMFDIGHKYLGFDWEKSGYSPAWKAIVVNSDNLLNDLIDAGVFGASNMSRKHSSNMTLSAVAARKEGKRSHNSLIKTIFPSAEILEGRFSYLQKHRILLPLAWAQRLLQYGKETGSSKTGNNAAESIRIGNERIRLMREYGIIEKK